MKRPMTCDSVLPLLSDYHDDALSFDERRRVQAHLETCPACQTVVVSYERAYDALRGVPAPVPDELRRRVYACVAEIEAQQLSAPLGLRAIGMLRTTGATAGLLAVLAALLAAAVELSNATPSRAVLTATGAPAVAVNESTVPGAAGVATSAPASVQTMIASIKRKITPGTFFRVDTTEHNGSSITVTGELVQRSGSGLPRAIVPVRLYMVLAVRTPVTVMGTPTPFPTLPAGDGLVYLRLKSDNPFFLNRGNSRADLEWHAFSPGAQPTVLATPVPSAQMFTGVNSSLDGTTFAYSAMSTQARLSGVFSAGNVASPPTQVVSWPDRLPPDQGFAHRYVKQIYPSTDGRWLLSVVDTSIASVVITTVHGLQPILRIDLPTYNYVVSPDKTLIARIDAPNGRFGTLRVENLSDRQPAETIVAVGCHPVWSPNGRYLLFLAKDKPAEPDGTAGLYLWSGTSAAIRTLVTPTSAAQPFISSFTWAPDNRFFAFVVTATGVGGASQVWLGDAQTGVTWPSFTRRWIGGIAWVHGAGRRLVGPPMVVSAVPTTATAAPQTAGAVPPGTTPTPAATPTVYDVASNASNVLLSYYNAINRREYGRAYSYIAARSGQSLRRFSAGYADTRFDTILKILPAPYTTSAPDHTRTCVGLELVAHRFSGKVVRYGGWYAVQRLGVKPGSARSTWKIIMKGGTRMKQGGTAAVPPVNRCA